MSNSYNITPEDQIFLQKLIDLSSLSQSKEDALNQIVNDTCEYLQLVRLSFFESSINETSWKLICSYIHGDKIIWDDRIIDYYDHNIFDSQKHYEIIDINEGYSEDEQHTFAKLNVQSLYSYYLKSINYNYRVVFFRAVPYVNSERETFLYSVISTLVSSIVTQINTELKLKIRQSDEALIRELLYIENYNLSNYKTIMQISNMICDYFNLDFMGIYNFNKQESILNSHMIIGKTNKGYSQLPQVSLNLKEMPYLQKRVANRKKFVINDIDQFLNGQDKTYFASYKIKSLIHISSDGISGNTPVFWGDADKNREFSKREITLLEECTQILISVIFRNYSISKSDEDLKDKDYINRIYYFATSNEKTPRILIHILKEICEYLDVQRVSLCQFDLHNLDNIKTIQSYDTYDIDISLSRLIADEDKKYNFISYQKLAEGQSFYCPDVNILPEYERNIFLSVNIYGFYLIPIFTFGIPNHFIIASVYEHHKEWTEREKIFFTDIAHILETTVIRTNIENKLNEERNEKLRDQEFVNNIYNMATRSKNQNDIIVTLLEKICNYLNIDMITIYQYSDSSVTLDISHSYCRKNHPSKNTDIPIAKIPTILESIRNKDVFYCPATKRALPLVEENFLLDLDYMGHCSVPLQSFSNLNRFIMAISLDAPLNWNIQQQNLFITIAHILETTVIQKDIHDTISKEREKIIVDMYRSIADAKTTSEMIHHIFNSVGNNLGIDTINIFEIPIFKKEFDGKAYLTYSNYNNPNLDKFKPWVYVDDFVNFEKKLYFHSFTPNLVLPEQSVLDAENLEIPYLQSNVFIPLFSKEEIFGFAFFIYSKDRHELTEDEKITLEITAHIIESTLERGRREKVIYHKAYYDSLLDIPNRSKFKDDMTKILSNNKEGSIIFFDIDNFKNINDTYGHTYGDLLLIEVCDFLNTLNTPFYRFGGDEFIIILDGKIEYEVSNFCLTLLNRFRLPWNFGEQSQYCTASIGVAQYPQCGTTVDEIVKNSDIAMFKAKQNGKDRVSFFTNEINVNFSKRVRMEECMRTSIANGCHDFAIYYQPIIDLQTDKCISVEALLRWNNKELGLVMPDDFIPLAEYLNLIVPIGEWVLYNACKKSAEWEDLFKEPLKINVNVSYKQLQAPNFLDMVRNIINKVNIRPGSIILEITESINPRDVAFIHEILNELRELGLAIAMDDFGTGYSSLSNFFNIPVDIIKIDKSFITNIVSDKMQASFVQSITSLSLNMNKRVCIEGVETSEQLYVLKNMGNLISAQGYNFSKPLSESNFEQWYIEQYLCNK